MTAPSDADQGPNDPPTQDIWEPPPTSWEAPPSTAPRDGLGIAGLVLGVLAVLGSPGVVPGIVLGLLAVIFGVIARGRVRRGEAVHGGVATAGVVLGAIALVIAVVAGILAAIYLPRWTAAITRPTATVQQCVANAHGDRAAIRQCRQQAGQAGRPNGRHAARPAPATPAPAGT